MRLILLILLLTTPLYAQTVTSTPAIHSDTMSLSGSPSLDRQVDSLI
jgi:hypothetical protein